MSWLQKLLQTVTGANSITRLTAKAGIYTSSVVALLHTQLWVCVVLISCYWKKAHDFLMEIRPFSSYTHINTKFVNRNFVRQFFFKLLLRNRSKNRFSMFPSKREFKNGKNKIIKIIDKDFR